MNLVPLRAVFFEKRIPQNLPFVKTWQDMENAKSLPQSLKNDKKRCEGSGWRAKKRGAPLVEKRKICYTVLHDAPSPSGKAGDFDSPIVGSTPAGATRKRPLYRRMCSGLFIIFPTAA